MIKLSLLIFSLLLALSHAQKNKDVDTLIKSIFNTSPMPIKCGPQKECVKRFLCADGKIHKYGEDAFDIRLENPLDIGNVDKCNNYLQVCCDISKITSDSVVSTNPRTENTGCGYRNRDGVGFRIIGNENNEAQFGEFPWMVAILKDMPAAAMNNNIYKCGGSLIAPTVILTAAHCAINHTANTLIARAGEWDSKTELEILPHQDRRVREIIVHESFYYRALLNDVALLIVESAFEFAENIRPICLPATDITFDLARCYATGWGRDKFEEKGILQVILKKVEVPVVPRSICQANLRETRLSRHFELHESFICAGGEEGKDTCEGDGGSPLVCPITGQNERFYQAGIVAWGIECGKANIPGVYVNVAQFRPWINKILAEKGLDMSHFTP